MGQHLSVAIPDYNKRGVLLEILGKLLEGVMNISKHDSKCCNMGTYMLH